MPSGPASAVQSFQSYQLPDGEKQIILQETLPCTVHSNGAQGPSMRIPEAASKVNLSSFPSFASDYFLTAMEG